MQICGATFRLESFVCMGVSLEELHLHAPNLRVFHFNGDCSRSYNFADISSLVDAIVCAISRDAYDRDFNRVYMLDKIRHVEILTLTGLAPWVGRYTCMCI